MVNLILALADPIVNAGSPTLGPSSSGGLIGVPLLRPTPKLGLASPDNVGNDRQHQSNPIASTSFGFGLSSQNSPFPASLEQLLERQWEQGSQFLMGQAQHFDSKSIVFSIVHRCILNCSPVISQLSFQSHHYCPVCIN